MPRTLGDRKVESGEPSLYAMTHIESQDSARRADEARRKQRTKTDRNARRSARDATACRAYETSDQRVRQSTCSVCRKPVRPGAGSVLHFGAGGRVHSEECLKIAQNVTASDKSELEGVGGHPATLTEDSGGADGNPN